MPETEVELAVKKEPTSFGSAHAPGLSWLIIIFLLIISALAVIHFGQKLPPVEPLPTTLADSTATPTLQPRIYTISFEAGVFSPTNLRIHAGDTVRFKNDSSTAIRIVSDDIVGFDSIGDIPEGSYFSYTFSVRGTFEYKNKHNSNHVGTIIVR